MCQLPVPCNYPRVRQRSYQPHTLTVAAEMYAVEADRALMSAPIHTLIACYDKVEHLPYSHIGTPFSPKRQSAQIALGKEAPIAPMLND